MPDDGATSDQFGWSVAISGPIAIVGAPTDDDNGSASGSAYLFNAATGAQIAKLLPDDGAAADLFGWSVAMSGQVAIVGAWWDDDNGLDSGSAYLFGITTGTQFAKLLPDDGADRDGFGLSVAISGQTAIVGSPSDDDNGISSGSAYLFDVATGTQIAKLLPGDGGSDNVFGNSVAISGDAAAVGAEGDDDNGSQSGSAYSFNLNCSCPADFNEDGTVDSRDFIAFLNAFSAGDPSADFNNDEVVNTLDFLAFLNAYNEGCE